MAYMSQERKRSINEKLKPVMKRYGLKYSLAVHNHSTLTLTITAGPIDFLQYVNPQKSAPIITDRKSYHFSVNQYWIFEHYIGYGKEVLQNIANILNDGNHDNSRIEIDYFDVGWYVNIQIGKWGKPYILQREGV